MATVSKNEALTEFLTKNPDVLSGSYQEIANRFKEATDISITPAGAMPWVKKVRTKLGVSDTAPKRPVPPAKPVYVAPPAPVVAPPAAEPAVRADDIIKMIQAARALVEKCGGDKAAASKILSVV